MTHLPGQSVSVQDDEWGTKCDSHPSVDAVKRICTESDSFGSEYANLCQTCCDEREQAINDKEEDPEQWETCKCGNREPSLISYRDMDEGMHGPVYEHCSKCHEKMNARIAKELDDEPDYPDYYNADDFIDRWEDDEPEPHYEDLSDEQLDIVVDYLKREWNLNFVKKEHTGKSGDMTRSIVLDINGVKAYKRVHKQFRRFIAADVDNELIDAIELKEAICEDGSDIDTAILCRRISDRKIEGSKRAPALSFAQIVQHAQAKKKIKRKLSKEFITPIYSIELTLAKVYY